MRDNGINAHLRGDVICCLLVASAIVEFIGLDRAHISIQGIINDGFCQKMLEKYEI